MSVIKKINQSRYNLKKYLENEWDVSTIPDYSDQDIEQLYSMKIPSGSDSISFGYASSCNFTVRHKLLEKHSLHVIYYNFPELNKNPLKITKNICDKISNLYKSEILSNEDSVIIITYEDITEGLQKSIEELYSKFQEELDSYFSEDLKEENLKLSEDKQLENRHFKNCHIFFLDTLSIDILEHKYVPKHEIIRNKQEIETILKTCNCTFKQLPIIKRDDAIGKIFRIAPGDICKIIRINTNSGESVYYRGCH